ncbi:MAG: RNA pyrophosphohydrolase [Rhodospirillales bacterium]|nr:RNA pyrophosphohydrolase [Rhodospirillales bacterium]
MTDTAASFEALPYRPGVGIMLFSRQGLVFVAKRIDMPSDAWQMPQGGIDDGENPRQAALRELAEEIGTAKAEFLAEGRDWKCYDLPPELRGGRLWGGRFRGQSQKWFAMRFTGTDGDINIATEHPEFLAWKWTPVDTLPQLIVPFKRSLYRELIAEFGHLAAATPSKATVERDKTAG